MTYMAVGLASLFVLATLLPFIPTEYRWVRVLDFPRVQIAAGLVVSAVVVVFFARLQGAYMALALFAITASLGYQVYQIAQYTPLVPKQAAEAADPESGACLKIFVANVLMENRNADALLRMVRDTRPDIALFVETDDWWDDRLTALEKDYPHALRRPQDNYYSMVLYSRLELVRPEVRFLIRKEIPSLRTGLRLPGGGEILLYGLHPVPPPLADTDMRDAEILVVAKEVRDGKSPAIVAGDLNDVSWSHTTRLFMRISGMLDPRIGRGLFSTYNAKNPLLRWPLDHIFLHRDFRVREVRLLDSFGSDHYPIYADVCYQPDRSAANKPMSADGDDIEDAAEKIRDGRKADPDGSDYPKPANDAKTIKK